MAEKNEAGIAFAVGLLTSTLPTILFFLLQARAAEAAPPLPPGGETQ